MFILQLFSDPFISSGTVLLVTFSIVLHELSHGLVAIWQGDETPKETGHISLNPVTHMGWSGIIFLMLLGISWGSMPVNPHRFRNFRLGSVLVALAGPLSNLLLSVLFACLFVVLNHWSPPDELLVVQKNASLLIYLGAVLNLVLCVFNLIPLPPLDGFQIIKQIIPSMEKLANNTSMLFLLLLLVFNIPGFSRMFYDNIEQAVRQMIRSSATILSLKNF